MSEAYKLFVGPKLKLSRAKKHLDELAERIEVFVNSKPFNMYIRTFPDRNPSFLFGMIGPIPPDVSLVYGDAVHCLRAALDLLACDVVRANHNSADQVKFPFARDAGGLETQIKRSNFDKASPPAIDLLRQTAPYWKGNDALRALHQLDLQDKHQMVLPTYPMIHVSRVVLDWGPGTGVVFENNTFGPDLEIGIPAIPNDVSVEGDITVKIVFDQNAPEPLRYKDLLKTLKGFHDMVSGIIESFELLIMGTATEPPAISPYTANTPINDRPKVIVYNFNVQGFTLHDVKIVFGDSTKVRLLHHIEGMDVIVAR